MELYVRGINEKINSIHQLTEAFKDLRTGKVAKELKRIESQLQKDDRWSMDPEEIMKGSFYRIREIGCSRLKRQCGDNGVMLCG